MNESIEAVHSRIKESFALAHTLFKESLGSVRQQQQSILMRILLQNATSEYGRTHQFITIQTIEEFQQHVPLTTYITYEPFINRMSNGEQNVLTTEPVNLLEPTSGTSGATKYIPYTEGLRKEFENGIQPWLYELYESYPELEHTYAYWSVSPATSIESKGAIPIGFPDDTAYFSQAEQKLIQFTLAVPPTARLIENSESFRYVTLLFLLRERRLGMISVWNPIFLTALFASMRPHLSEIIADIRTGVISAELSATALTQLQPLLSANPERAAELSRLANDNSEDAAFLYSAFPHLRLISCWTDSNAATYLDAARNLFPNATIQGKGLIATEAFISLPLREYDHPVLAVRSHFFEFIDCETNTVHLADELTDGKRYSVIVTTSGGLYRYRLNDIVEITGFAHQAPLLRFMTKEQHISDQVGEKLSASHIEIEYAAFQKKHALPIAYFLIAAENDGTIPHYTLFVEADSATTQQLQELMGHFSNALRANYHYRHCRNSLQLGPLRLFRVASGGAAAYLRRLQSEGVKLGGIKPTFLSNRTGWSQWFTGAYIDVP